MSITREITFSAAYDRRDKDPRKNYGVHGVTMRWYVKGEKGAVQFVVFTNWHLKHVEDEMKNKAYLGGPVPADLGYHSKIPMYEGHEPMKSECDVIGCQCYYDGSGLNAEPVLDLLRTQGGDAVWKYLEEYYADVFGEKSP